MERAWDVVQWLLGAMPGSDEIAKKIILAIIGTAAAAVSGWIGWKLLKFVRSVVRDLISDGDARRRLDRAREAVQSDRGLWLTEPMSMPDNYKLWLERSIPIITLANLKGGVGKSTMTANLAALFALQGQRVLVIDLDFQGSLSSMVLGENATAQRPAENGLSMSSQALMGHKSAEWLTTTAWAYQPSAGNRAPVTATGKPFSLHAILGFYDLARSENRLLIEWLIKDQPPDMPYSLAKLLLSDHVQNTYDRIFIDAPPRLSTAAIQAFCASTHVLIPTVMDQLSAEAVVTFAKEVIQQKNNGRTPYLQFLGVVGSMLPAANVAYPIPTVKTLNDKLADERIQLKVLPLEAGIKDLPAFARAAGTSIAILDGTTADRQAAVGAFQALFNHIVHQAPTKRR